MNLVVQHVCTDGCCKPSTRHSRESGNPQITPVSTNPYFKVVPLLVEKVNGMSTLKSKTRNDWVSILIIYIQIALVILGIFSFVTPLTIEPTADDPAGQAGLYAALVALCTAGIVLAEAARESKVRLLPKVCIGVGTLATAYLWIADEAGVHPMNPSLPGSILLLYLLAAVVFSIPMLLIITSGESNWLSRGRSSGKDGDSQ